MDLTKVAFLALLGCVGIERLIELTLSRRHQRDLVCLGARKQADPCYPWMIALHASVLVGAGLEVVILHRPFIVSLASIALAFFVLATLLRWWVIRTLGTHWNTRVVDSASLGVVSKGPFRWVRHPNYLAVFVEMIALPLIHSAWITALVSAIGNAFVLSRRLQAEEGVLAAVPAYRAAMAAKPRFLPKLF
jgi:methyltransferase